MEEIDSFHAVNLDKSDWKQTQRKLPHFELSIIAPQGQNFFNPCNLRFCPPVLNKLIVPFCSLLVHCLF